MNYKRWVVAFMLWMGSLAFVTACGGGAPAPQTVAEATTAPAATAALATASAPVAEGARRFVVVPEESKASYIVHEEFFAGALAKYGIEAGKQEVVGSTQEVAGELELKVDDPANALVSGRFTVNLPSLATTRSLRDGWIRDNALQSNKYPIAEFVATAIENAPASYTDGEEVTFQLLGDLTVRDRTQPATFDVTATLTGDTIKGVATTAMQITDFGFDPPSFANTLTVANDLTIQIELTAKAQ
ncbi:MAG: YceI family protein [Caldilineaceae bacterium]